MEKRTKHIATAARTDANAVALREPILGRRSKDEGTHLQSIRP
jgi:hypothetical protein